MTNERWLQRALDAEDRCEELQQRVDMLVRRVGAALDMDPASAIAALSWVNRAEQAERLLADLLRYIHQRSIATAEFPPGWIARAEAQLRVAEITKRDSPEIERVPDGDDYWATGVDPEGRPMTLRERYFET